MSIFFILLSLLSLLLFFRDNFPLSLDLSPTHVKNQGRLRDKLGVFPRTAAAFLFSGESTVEHLEMYRHPSQSSVLLPDATLLSPIAAARSAKAVTAQCSSKPNFSWEIDFQELQLGDFIGRGGFSNVVKGTWRGETVAIKRLVMLESESLESIETRLKAEAELFSVLSHRNIVRFKGACSIAPNFCLVMEYVPHGSLQRHLAATLSPATIVSWAEQIARVSVLAEPILE